MSGMFLPRGSRAERIRFEEAEAPVKRFFRTESAKRNRALGDAASTHHRASPARTRINDLKESRGVMAHRARYKMSRL